MKIKPGDNDTAHFCSLLMPDGYRGEAVYEMLRKAEDRVRLLSGGVRILTAQKSDGLLTVIDDFKGRWPTCDFLYCLTC